MRVSLKRALQWVFVLALLQVGIVYYWSIKRTRRIRINDKPHRYIESSKTVEDGTCSFKTCPEVKEGMLNVHFVPHSHIDVGWLKTVDQYYTGDSPEHDRMFVHGCVRCTLNSTIKELLKDPSRRFIFIEMKYFSRYWNEIDQKQKEVIRQLIKERRLELVNGGWVMSDAGVTMYNDIIDQHTLGFDFIRDTFGPCAQTKTAWHVDQFGHSREHASIFAQMGYDSLFVGRIDFQDLAERKKKKNLELVWDTSPKNLKERATLFTQTTFDGYYAPPAYVFDNIGSPDTSDRQVFNFVRILKERARTFKTDHLLVPMGSDFGYITAKNWFDNMDPLIKKINEMQPNAQDKKMNLIYSTPSCYTYYVNQEKQVFETKTDDFHPYGVTPGAYWTGYFTTRGGFKMHIKLAGQILQSCKQLSIFSGSDDAFGQIDKLRDAMAIMQHHDGITGTQMKHVLNDYNKILSAGIASCESVMAQSYQRLLGINEGSSEKSASPPPVPAMQFCRNLNISSCDISEGGEPFITIIYNPLSWEVDQPIRLPIKLSQVQVTDGDGQTVPHQLVPVPEGIRKIPERPTVADTEVVFQAHLPPMSVTSFKVEPGRGGAKPVFEDPPKQDVVIENEHLSLTFSGKTGTLNSIFNKDSQIKLHLVQDFMYYEAQQGSFRSSGAYVFIPKNISPKRVGGIISVDIKVVKGDLVQEVHQTFCSWVTQIVRLYKGAKYAEFQWVVGPVDDGNGVQGKEVISLFTSDLDTSDKFYTDSNGREIMERQRDVRETWDYEVKDHVSGNYYPITSKIFIQDVKKNVQLTVMPDRPQGGSSLASGAMELMVHRKLILDDGLGVGEPLNDRGIDNKGIIFTGKHFLCLDTIQESVPLTKHLALQLHLAAVPMFSKVQDGKNMDSALKQHTFLSNSLPPNVQVLTLDRITQDDPLFYLLRLEHVFEVGEDPLLSQPAEISLEYLFKPFDIVTAEETTLGGNFKPHEITRLQWKTSDGPTETSIDSPDYVQQMTPPFKIKISPMEIRTFRVQVARDSL